MINLKQKILREICDYECPDFKDIETCKKWCGEECEHECKYLLVKRLKNILESEE